MLNDWNLLPTGSLDPGTDANSDEIWLDEAQQRLAAYIAGAGGITDAFEALAEFSAS